ncbi:SPFH/Band 7/PHB domain-containing membrane-associated protein family [Theobroma cacao]|uniref:SPFH/Band 7/PHB domain-containing membrane-associated protein family n=1 Tax=Theobroma cacao TaxID=3641 RepID=A0A061EAU3_THECC|nr:SPFH/Band 7/PHB domain-containing membrane-associated protein family [Theobroma cacao]
MDPQQQREAATPSRPPPPPRPAQSVYSFPIIVIVFAFIVIASSAMIPPSSNIKNTLSILHQVPEGHVGVYWRGGALLKTITEPGFHLKMPLITQHEPVLVTLQTDQVRDIPCGTKGGVMINFEKIEVVNRLRKEYVYETLLNYGVHYDNTWIYDKIHHEINQFCSSHTLQQVYIDVFDQIDEKMKDALQGDCTRYAPGIEILSVRVTKPTIPESIRRNYEQMEEERTKDVEDCNEGVEANGGVEDGNEVGEFPYLVPGPSLKNERQKVVEKESETQKKMAISEAEKTATVSKILMEQKLMEKESARRQQEIENQMYIAREKSLADADFYRVMKEAEANKLKLTPEFLELKFIEAIAYNTKIFFGDKIPNMVMDQRLLGNFLQNASRQVAMERQLKKQPKQVKCYFTQNK